MDRMNSGFEAGASKSSVERQRLSPKEKEGVLEFGDEMSLFAFSIRDWKECKFWAKSNELSEDDSKKEDAIRLEKILSDLKGIESKKELIIRALVDDPQARFSVMTALRDIWSAVDSVPEEGIGDMQEVLVFLSELIDENVDLLVGKVLPLVLSGSRERFDERSAELFLEILGRYEEFQPEDAETNGRLVKLAGPIYKRLTELFEADGPNLENLNFYQWAPGIRFVMRVGSKEQRKDVRKKVFDVFTRPSFRNGFGSTSVDDLVQSILSDVARKIVESEDDARGIHMSLYYPKMADDFVEDISEKFGISIFKLAEDVWIDNSVIVDDEATVDLDASENHFEDLFVNNIFRMRDLEASRKGAVKILYEDEASKIQNFVRYPLDMLVGHFDAINSDVPYGLILSASNDHNGGFNEIGEDLKDSWTELNRLGYVVRIMEAGSKIDVARRFLVSDKRYASMSGGHKVGFAIICGHGTEKSIDLGPSHSARSSISASDLRGKGVGRFGNFFEPHAPIVLVSCSTGGIDKITGIGFASELSTAIPNASISAPEESSASGSLDISPKIEAGRLVFDVVFQKFPKGNLKAKKFVSGREVDK